MRRTFVLAAVAAALVVGLGGRALADPAPIADCVSALGTPTQAECTAACSGKGTCPAGTYTWNTGNCDVAVTYTPGPAKAWVRVVAFNAADGECNHASHPNDPTCNSTKDEKKYTQKYSDTYTSSWTNEWGWGVDLKAGVNWKIIEISGGGHYDNKYSTGQQNTSTTESTIEETVTANAPCCGISERWYLVWKRDYTASASVTHTITGGCKSGGAYCLNSTTIKTGNRTVNMSGTRYYARQESCDIACALANLNKCCSNGSSTSGTRAACDAIINVCTSCP
jgi:hypothetical protein